MKRVTRKKIALAAILTVLIFGLAGMMELAEARSRMGGRSFSRSPSVSRQAPRTQPRQTATNPAAGQTTRNPMGGAFTRGLAGGVMGGFLGSMLFGGTAHGMGAGGFGGSGIGLFEILLIGGLGFMAYRWFSAKKRFAAGTETGYPDDRSSSNLMFSGADNRFIPEPNPDEDPLVLGVKEIWTVDPDFNPDTFKETAQNLFFKIQAGWTRRDTNVLKAFVGDQLLGEYARHFEEMKQKGEINRLENIAVRSIELIHAGVEQGEIFVTVRFTANLLDYTTDEKSNEVIKGDPENPVKFEEDWTFAAPVGTTNWKLEGIENG
ncbi:MAG: Tim44 domain-containing protein [Desulfobacteraceae bacterium]|nr:MAG: Tim44 domain-containing protein [Desulfobacteraceae bacterium]